MPYATLARLIQSLVSLFRSAWNNYGIRLWDERQAGRNVFPDGKVELIDVEFDKTIARLRGEELEDGWISPILTTIAHPFVTPQFLREQEVKDWLVDEQVRRDLKTLAIRQLLGNTTPDTATQKRLVEAYSTVSTNPPSTAIEATNGIVAILVAGYKASLETKPAPVAALVQAATSEHRGAIETVAQQVSSVAEKLNSIGPDALVVRVHTEQASNELRGILKKRSFRTDEARDQMRVLVEKLFSGELRQADQGVKVEALYWAARLHVFEAQHVPQASRYLHQLRDLDPKYDARIVDAFILEHKDDAAGALRILRDINTADGHSTLWLVLSRTQGKPTALAWMEGQPDHGETDFFTGIGWQNVAVTLCEMGMWERAATILSAAQVLADDWPDLAFVEGVVNAALLLPAESRPQALSMNIFHPHIQVIQGPDADQHRTRACHSFERAVSLLTGIGENKRAQVAKDWILWLRLTNDNLEIRKNAQDEVRAAMGNGKRAVDYLPVALRFEIDFDKEPLQRYLANRKEMGGLEGQEVFAEVNMAEVTMTAREFAEFLESEEARLAAQVPKSLLSGKRVEALVADGQIARARHVLEERKNECIDHDYDRLNAMIIQKEGGDARTKLEEIYRQTGGLLDLQNLAREVGKSRDWGALRPLLEELFRRERTSDNARRLVECLHQDRKCGDASIVSFLNDNADLTKASDDLKSAKAWACFYLGNLKEARGLNDQLLKARNHPADLLLDTNLAIQTGDWERFPAIVDREWERRDSYDANLLLRLASLAAETDASAGRAFELARLAASKAPDNPSILMNAYSLAFQLGRDHDADPTWVARASELSTDSGPVHQVDMRTLVEKMVPANRERKRLIERSLLQGEVPLHMAADVLHMPLSRMLLDLPKRNTEQSDGRRRAVIPIVSGARRIVELNPSWTVGLDITCIMVLAFLGLLPKVLRSFTRVVLSAETMVVLLNERRRVRFHQPSRIKDAENLRELIEKGQLKITKITAKPPEWLVAEVGQDLAEMLEQARMDNGRVIHPRPIYQLRTFLDKHAELREYEHLILSTTDLANLLLEAGKVSHDLHEQARRYLLARDKDGAAGLSLSGPIFDAPIYIDDLAITYLQQAQFLSSICRIGIDVRVHPSMNEEQSALVAASREGERLNEQIGEIVSALRVAIESGKAAFLPRQDVADEKIGSISHFLSDTGPCDILCIDDRFMNRHGFLTDKKGRNVPIICTLDLIGHLENLVAIDTEARHVVLHRLREAGFGLIPVTLDELERLLHKANFDSDNNLIENVELRVIRQYLMRIRSLNMVQSPLEEPFLAQLRLTCVLIIRRLWQDDDLPVARVLALTDWVWDNVSPSPLDWEHLARLDDGTVLRQRHVNYLIPLLSPLGLKDPIRYDAFRQWIERSVIAPLLPANDRLIDDLAERTKLEINSLVKRISDGNTPNPDR
ncbi:MAG: hypothetical protein V9G17_03365 [Nitrospira sp.]|nr:hypothetical protein [Nitrospira sp.]HQY58566.1 hypothetical protein [Nitrospira sp.]HRA96256.1 hypothetical protein [Nitrospira sp.]